MNLLLRDKDIFLGGRDVEILYIIKKFPIYMGVTNSKFEEDIFADMEWGISKKSGMIQLLRLVPEDILYKDSHNGSVGDLWKEHHIKFAEFIHKNIEDFMGNILEIGGGNGILNVIYNEKYGSGGKWIIVEPSTVKPVDKCKARYIRKAWAKEIAMDIDVSEVEYLVHSHVLEHLYDIESFMLQNEQLLKNGKKMIFSVPNLKETLRRKYTNALNFEHTYFISEDYVEETLRKHSFEIVDKQYFKEDHSIFYAAKKVSNLKNDSLIDYRCLYLQNKEIFFEFIEFHRKLILDFNRRIKNEKFSIYLFGAHIFSQYLISFGLDTSKIQCILDNDVMKQGKRLYGTKMIVKSPKILAVEENPVVILRVANYAEEIKNDIINNINSKVIFWEK